MITRGNLKKARNMALRVFITASISVGAVSFKNGKALLMIEDVSDRLGIGDSGKIILVLLGSSGVIYTLAFTRLPSFWKKFNFESNTASPADSNVLLPPAYKYLRATAYIIWVARAPFNLLNTYIGSQTLLRYIGVESDSLLSIIISIYAALANQVSYDVYTFKSIFANLMRLAEPQASQVNNQQNYYSKLALKFFMDLGTLSFSSLSFFLTKESLRSIPVSRDNFSNSTIFALSGASALSAFFSEVFSKNLDLHHLIDQGYENFIKNLKTNSFLFYPHVLMGTLFTLTMGMSYYMGVLNLSEDIGADTCIPNKSFLAILIFSIFAISGGALEFAFSIKPMFDTIQPTVRVDLDPGDDPEESVPLLLDYKTTLDNVSEATHDLASEHDTLVETPEIEEKIDSTFNGLRFFDTPTAPTQTSRVYLINEKKKPVATEVHIYNSFG